MYYEVTKGLYLERVSATVYEVSQPIDMGKDTTILLQAWVVKGNLSGLNKLTITAQGSNDLDCWDLMGSLFSTTIQLSPPLNVFFPSYSPAEVRFRFVRLHYKLEGTGAQALFGASIQTFVRS